MAESNAAIQSAAIIGAGTMGRGIAYLFAQKAFARCFIIATAIPSIRLANISRKTLNKKVEQGKIALQDKGAVLANLVFTSVFETIADSDLVIETIAEQEQTKL